MDDKRIDQFIEWFGESVKNYDCDPALYMINYFFDRFEFNQEQKLWYCWLFGTTYQFPTTYVIWNEFPDFHLVGVDRLKKWNNENYNRLRYQVDTKWNKGHLPSQFLSYQAWVGNSTQQEKISSILTGNPNKDFTAMWNEAKSWHKFGRYTTWFYLQTLKQCCDIPINSPTLLLDDYEGSKSHRNGLCLALGEDEKVNTKLSDYDLIEFQRMADNILEETQKRYPKLKNKLDNFAMETCLCSFKKLFRTTRGRYMGYYHDRQAEEIKQAEQDGWTGINWNPLWQAREESINKEFLGGVIDKEKMKLFLQKNPVKKTKSLTLIGGLPATGKTTLMRQIRTKLGNYTKKEHGLLRYEDYPNHVVLGIYDDSTFDGTDKLSMAVMKDTTSFLLTNAKKVLVEGDRLFNKKFIDAATALGYDVNIQICSVTDFNELLKRYQKRGQMQSQIFIKGRHTKLMNIILKYPHTMLDTNKPISAESLTPLYN